MLDTHSRYEVLALSEEILRRLEEIHEDLKEIKAEVKTTNGRVTKLEMWRYGLEQVKATRSWRFPAAVGLVTGTTLAIIGAALAVFVKILGG